MLLEPVGPRKAPESPPRGYSADGGSVAGRAVDSLAQQVRVAVVPGVLLDHVDINPAQAHVGFPARIEERLVQVPARGRLPGKLDLPQIGGEVLLRVGV